MRLHDRTLKVQAAQFRFNDLLLSFQQEHGLSYVEMVNIIAGSMQTELLKYMLRAERHPEDPSKKADEA